MRKLFITVSACVALASAANATDVQAPTQLYGVAGLGISKDAFTNKYTANVKAGLGFSKTTNDVTYFASGNLKSINSGSVTLDKWDLGVSTGPYRASFGRQSDIFVRGGFKPTSLSDRLGGTVLYSPNDAVDSLIVGAYGFSGFVGFNNTTHDLSSVSNYQLSYSGKYRAVDYAAAVDYNRSDKKTAYVVAANTYVLPRVSVGAIVTHKTDTAYEINGNAYGFTGFIDSDKSKFAKQVGVGYSRMVASAQVYAQGLYDTTTKTWTPEFGTQFRF